MLYAGKAAEKPLDQKASAGTALQSGVAKADIKAGNKVVERLGQPKPITGTVENGEHPNGKPEHSSCGVEAPQQSRAGWKYVWPVLPKNPDGEQKKAEKAGQIGSGGDTGHLIFPLQPTKIAANTSYRRQRSRAPKIVTIH